MTRSEWLLIAGTIRDERAEHSPDNRPALLAIDRIAERLAAALADHENKPSDRWLRRHPGESTEGWRPVFDPARFLAECAVGTAGAPR